MERTWYGELEFFFSTSCGLLLSILMYYGRTSEEIMNEDEIEMMDTTFHIKINQLHEHFIQITFPSLIRKETAESSVKSPQVVKEVKPRSPKIHTKQMESLYRNRHTQRMSQLINTKNDKFFVSIQHLMSGESQKESEGVSPLDLSESSFNEEELPFSSVKELDNETAVFRNSIPLPEKEERPSELDESEDSLNYMKEIGETITNTWLMLYSALIRVLDFLVNVSLSYEKHALYLLRIFSIIALVICCRCILVI